MSTFPVRRHVMARPACAVGVVFAALLRAACARWFRPGEPPAPPPLKVDAPPVAERIADNGLPDHWQRGAFMQIDVRAYQDSDGDGVGDIKGLTRRLDHLKDLGVRGLLLLPVQPGAAEGRGDAVNDARSVDPLLGTLADVDELLKQAHARSIGVVFDYPLNHSSANHAFFVDARRDRASPWRDWFVWAAEAPRGWDARGRNPWHAGERGGGGYYYGVVGANRPDFNFKNPKVIEHHLDNLRFWLNRGVDGFRLLGVTHLVEHDAARWNDQPESRRVAQIVAQAVKAYPKRFLACDAGVDVAAWADICGGAFAQGFGAQVVAAARGDAAAVQPLADQLRRVDADTALWLSSLDATAGTVRLWDEVSGDAAAYRVAAASYLLLPGAPFIHYGEEVGQQAPATTVTPPAAADAAAPSASLALRAPMSWAAPNAGSVDGFSTAASLAPSSAPSSVPPSAAAAVSASFAANLSTYNAAAQRQEFASVYNTYKDLLELRNRRPSVARGSIEAVAVRGQVLSFVRVQGDERTLVVINYGARRVELDIAGLPRRARVAPIHPKRAGASYVAQIVLADAGGRLAVGMPPRSARVFDVEPQRRD